MLLTPLACALMKSSRLSFQNIDILVVKRPLLLSSSTPSMCCIKFKYLGFDTYAVIDVGTFMHVYKIITNVYIMDCVFGILCMLKQIRKLYH